ncbi:orotidine 5'-phosphate decarboxylase [Batrachochytrium salamandrivorans]|nr:orotidine 5'-phosphate decarboxylase [Batrachochytrium salamandrivorans]
MSLLTRSYTQRAAAHSNLAAIKLLKLMDSKRTNLCVAADVTTKAELLHLADTLGPYICIFKTHIDIVTDFDQDLVSQLCMLAKKHQFLIFEDRKFADIGNTVKLQYSQGVYRIASWADITNAHPLPGEGVVQGLKEVGLSLGSMAVGAYSDEALAMARRNRDFVFGFIGQRRLESDSVDHDDFIYMTPGVGMADPSATSTTACGDGLGQQYRTPEHVILEVDVMLLLLVVASMAVQAVLPRRHLLTAKLDGKLI